MSIFWFIVVGLYLYTGLQFRLLWPSLGDFAIWVGTLALFWLMLGWQFFYRRHASAIERPWFSWLAWGGGGTFGLWATFIMLSIPIDLAAVAYLVAQGHWPGWGQQALAAGLASSGLIAALGLRQTAGGPVVRELTVPIAGLPPDLDGLRIAQISDLHVGPTIRRPYVERVVSQVLAAEPDLIAITGDLADGHADRLAEHVAPFEQLRAPLGTYYVTGNHEYYWGARQWLAKLAELGCVPLVDAHVTLERGASRIVVGGVSDASAHRFIAEHSGDPQQAMAGAGPAALRLLLAHRPDASVRAEAAGFDLQLSGHTHGGQFFPFNLVVRLAHRHHRGLHRHGRMWLYVNPGTGYWGPPHRFWIPAEITLLRLRCAAAAPDFG